MSGDTKTEQNDSSRQDPKLERERLESFLQSIEEAHPIITALAKHPGVCADVGKVQREMGVLYGYQSSTTDLIAKKLGLRKENKDHQWLIRKLSVVVGELVISSRDDEDSLDEVGPCLAGMFEMVSRHKNEWNMPGGGVALENLRIGTRIAVIDALRIVKDAIGNMPMGHDVEKASFSALMLTVTLAWDMSGSWKKDISATDRELLFQHLIRHIGRATAESWESVVMVVWGDNDQIPTESRWNEMLVDFREMVTENHMGHEAQIEVVISRCRKLIGETSESVIAEHGGVRGRHLRVLKNKLSSEFVVLAQQAWQSAMEGLWERFEAMSPDEQRRWEAEEGSRPMDLALFDQAFEAEFAVWYREVWSKPMDLRLFEEGVKKNLVWLWGTADAILRSYKDSKQKEQD